MRTVAVLLATYNGGLRIKTQLQSLLYQSYQDFDVFVHDDCSTDDTIPIIEDFVRTNISFNLTILKDTHKRGAKGSFMWLLQNVEAKYYMFCDQDDLWLPNKIEQSVNLIEQLEHENHEKPICVHTDLAIADGFYNIIAKSLWDKSKINPNILEDKDYIQVFNCVTGCTMQNSS